MKDPAFLFYSSDFLTGVSDLSMEERGIYITLLCLQHQKGRLSEKMIRLCCGNATASATQDVMQKFEVDENGLYYNKRLEIEIEKRKQHTDKQRDRAIKGWEKRKNNDSHDIATASATAMPLENAIDNDNRIRNIDSSIVLKSENQIFENGSSEEFKAARLQGCNPDFVSEIAPEYYATGQIKKIDKYLIEKGCYTKMFSNDKAFVEKLQRYYPIETQQQVKNMLIAFLSSQDLHCNEKGYWKSYASLIDNFFNWHSKIGKTPKRKGLMG